MKLLKSNLCVVGNRIAIRAVFVPMACLLIAGCGPRIPANPTSYPVHGTVTMNGEPVTKGYVVFTPAEGSTGTRAEGQIKEDGSYEARAFVGQQGTTAGEYIVWFSPTSMNYEGVPSTEGFPVPKKFLSEQTSDIKQTVTSSDNTIDIEIPEAADTEEPEE